MKQERIHTDPKHIRDIVTELQDKLNKELLGNVKIDSIKIKITIPLRTFLFLMFLNMCYKIKSGFKRLFSKKPKHRDPENINQE